MTADERRRAIWEAIRVRRHDKIQNLAFEFGVSKRTIDLLAGQNALNQLDRLEQAILSLDEMPERYHLYDKEPWKERNLRIMPVGNYLVFYIPRSEEKTVTVIRVMYGRRDIDAQLKQTKLSEN